MGDRGKKSTGGNTEPMPFIRKWGGSGAPPPPEPFQNPLPPVPMSYDDIVAGPAPPPSFDEALSDRDHGDRDRDRRDRDRDRDRGDRDKRRDRDRDRDRRRSRSRDRRRHRSRSGSHDRDRRRRRDRSRSNERRRERERSRSPMVKRERLDYEEYAREETKSSTPSGGLFPIARPQGAPSLLTRPDVKLDPNVTGVASTEGMSCEERRRERKSRWSNAKSFVPGMPTILPSNLSEDQRQGYLLQLEIEEATRKLRLGDFLGNPDPRQRSPSPEPVYDSNGKRLNTREIRKRQELEQLRHEKIQNLLRINPNYKPPADYRMPNIRLHDKVWIPQDDNPEINFVGLLIGPRGNTLKALESETGAKIIIRGKGSVKEGKLGRREGPMPGENEPLHAYVTGTDSSTIKKACEKIKNIISEALNIPDGQNELRKLQLRELALLNGTLRPEDAVNGMRCSNCGSDQHKSYECPDAPNVTANIVCSMCGGAGHIARDCKTPRTAIIGENGEMLGMDDEYSALMAELGEQPAKEATPIVRVNLTQRQQPQNYSWGAAGGAVGSQWHSDPSAAVAAQYLSQLHGSSQQQSLSNTVESAAAYAAWNMYQQNSDQAYPYPTPVPPPPPSGGSSGQAKAAPSPADLAAQAMSWVAAQYAAPPPPPPSSDA
ncbi:hypothetical protein L596_018369 [Steinernema carpocapsae]|uniref:Branchpoint-bridging protein n=1 Tax=Steinernema carpocapsae TaxID=34508 RepID=A0A4U5N4W8_STECR|nr:hypothetical protein L596_018369 [Steinernema carpocapsae]